MDNKTTGISLFTVLTIIFVVLKLVGVIHWSWWLVLLPTIIQVGLSIVGFVISLIVMLVLSKVQGRKWSMHRNGRRIL